MKGIERLKEIDRRWAERWSRERLFEADPDSREKVFVTFPFPYMNGPLHLGHAFTSTRVDVYARFKRMQGYNVLFPWAWHLTGEPIAGAAERVKRGDEAQLRIFREVDGVPEEELKKFTEPEYIARYYIREARRVLHELGHSIDWRREFTTTSLNPAFSKFIEWQYLTLRDKGYVSKGTHPVVWCPHDASPTGDHDRLMGEGVSPTKFVLLKFPFEDAFLVAATLRPETIYGVTNMWVNPEATYAMVRVNGERWVVSEQAVPKLREQKDEVEVEAKLSGAELLGRHCTDPVSGRKVPVLPAGFVDPDSATGVVMSVPSHAPYDYAALKELQRTPERAERYGVSREVIEGIEPISLIETPGYGEHPAIEVCEQMGIESQDDPRLEEATERVYRDEYYKGVLRKNTGSYAGMRVEDAKDRLVSDFIAMGIADVMYELLEEVVCRCGTRCMVKILKDQWFLKYSDESWKAKVREALAGMRILPEEARANFVNTIEWLEDKACARKGGLGTPLPWDPEWKVETLSDSTVYMAFYTVAKYVNQGRVDGEKLSREVFDYIFYGRGKPEELAERCGTSADTLREMRSEFLYWMPVDLRNSAKELIPNHLTFFLFHHVALFEPELWPRAIAVNGMISIEGQKMAKKSGNFVTVRRALEEYGASVTRCALMYASEGMRDPDWSAKRAKDMSTSLSSFFRLVEELVQREEWREEERNIDRWLRSRVQRHVREATESLEEMRTRSALQAALFDFHNDMRWYLRRDVPHRETCMLALKVWVRLLAPFAPALCEECWRMLGEEGFVSTASWPELREEELSREAEAAEELVMQTYEDVQSIISVTGIKPSKIFIYTAPGWKWRVLEVLRAQERRDFSELMQRLMQEPELRKRGKEVAGVLQEMLRSEPREAVRVEERKVLSEAAEFFSRAFDAEVKVYGAEEEGIYDPQRRSARAMPLKPAIYIEK